MIEVKESPNSKALFLDGVCQGVQGLDGEPLSPYMKPIMERINGLNNGSELLFLGLGMGILPIRAQERHHSVSVVESNPELVLLYGGLLDRPSAIYGDAIELMPGFELDWFDFILLDIWPNDPKAYCIDYFIECKKHLKKNGLFSMNYSVRTQTECDDMGRKLAAVFPNVKMNVFYADKDMTIPTQVVYFCQ